MVANTGTPRAVGIDVSAATLHVAIEDESAGLTFQNNAKGHTALIKVLTSRRRCARVVLESTSTYHLDISIALAEHPRCEVMVANARATKHFHEARNVRAKTDKVDAESLCEFARIMDFVPWPLPKQVALDLRAFSRRLAQLVKHQTRIKNQLHAAAASPTTPSLLIEDLEDELAQLVERIERTQERMLKVAQGDEEINAQVERLATLHGVGARTAACLVAEYLFIDLEMTSKQISAWAGLDPRPRESGTSLKGQRGISKRGNARLRAVLFMPAMTTIRKAGPFKDLYDRVAKASGIKLKGIVAVMRKLLVVSWAMFRTKTAFNAELTSPRSRREDVAA